MTSWESLNPDQRKASLIKATPLAWILAGGFVNENQKLLEFKNHRFMIDVYADTSDDLVCIKSAQVGFSVYAILKSLHELKYEQRNILYALPTREIVQSFVVPKVNPLIASNPLIAREVGADAVALKKVGDRFIYFKGGFSEREAISISVDTLVIDEYDRMPDMAIVSMFDSRLQAAEQPRRRRFSNPSGVGYGVDSLFTDSDQRHWFIKCPSCNHEWFIDFEASDDKRHYIDQEQGEFVCGACRGVLSPTDRRGGRWVAKYPDRPRHGFWISQMVAPWVTAKRILDQKAEMDVATFHAFVLGKAYTPSDLIVNRETILRACAPSTLNVVGGVSLGVDQKAGEMEWIALTTQGMIAHGKAKSWEEIEHLKLMWQATVVCDAMPYPTMPKAMAEKYDDWYICYFKESRTMDILDWKGSVVYADRTRLLDTVATEIAEAKLLFRENPSALEDYIADWSNIYRTTVEEADGRQKSTWLKKENRESDYPFATAYARVGLSRILTTGGGQLIEPSMAGGFGPITDEVLHNGMTRTTLGESVKSTLEHMD